MDHDHDADADLHSLTLANDIGLIHPHNEKAYRWLFARMGEERRQEYELVDRQPELTHADLAALIRDAELVGLSTQQQYESSASERN